MLDFIRNLDQSESADDGWTLDETGDWARVALNGDADRQFQYDPHGIQSAADVSNDTGEDGGGNSGEENYGWMTGFQGGMLETLIEPLHFEARDFDPAIGRWMEPEPLPLAYVDGATQFEFPAVVFAEPGGL